MAVFQEMREARNRIKVELANVTEEFNDLQQVINDLEEHGAKAADAKDRASTYQNFTTKTMVKRKRLVDGVPAGHGPDTKSTICLVCMHVCHEDCKLSNDWVDKGTPEEDDEDKHARRGNFFKGCACFRFGKSDTCTECEGKCGPADHIHERKVIEDYEEAIDEVIEDLKRQYEHASKDMQAALAVKDAKQRHLAMLRAGQQQKLKRIRKLCEDMRKICSRFNFVDELQSVINAMKMKAKRIVNTAARAEAEVAISKMTAFIDALSQQPGQLQSLAGASPGGGAAGGEPSGKKAKRARRAS